MMRSTTRGKTFLIRAGAVAFWLLLWQLMSMLIGQDILLVSPLRTLAVLGQLAVSGEFWQSVLHSFIKIALGFLLAIAGGTLFALLSYKSRVVRELLYPLVTVVKATPVASFVILALIWIKSQNLSVFTSFLMAFPIAYTNLLSGLQETDPKLLEMAQVFGVGFGKRLLYIHLPAVSPYFVSACSLSVGLCWKAGIAAEVIGLPARSVGSALYQAKIYLQTGEMFAWTLVIILVSLVFERAVLFVIRRLQSRIERM